MLRRSFSGLIHCIQLVYVAAEDYAAGVACGQRIKINTLRNEEIVVVAGQCLDCLPGDIEVSTDVFYVFEDSENIAFNANWNFIATDVSQQEITQPVKSIQTDSPTRVQAISSFLRSRPHHSPRALLSSRRNDIASVPNSHSTIQAGSVATPVLTSIPDKRDDNTSFTWYAVGLGACGHRNKPSDYVVALNAVEFGSGQQCGRKIEIHAEGKTAVAYIVDKCPGCVRGGLDLSQSLFEHFAPTKKGVLHGSWRFI